MSHGHDVELSDNEPSVSLTVRHPSGRELLVTVTLTTEDPDADPVVHEPALVVYLDTEGWEPTPDLLRVNVNDGAIWNYPDEGTQEFGATGADLRRGQSVISYIFGLPTED